MIDLRINRKSNEVPVLSKIEIEVLAKEILQDYNSELLNEPAPLDVEHLLECYAGLEIDYKDLSHNQSILGMIVFNDGYVPVYDEEEQKAERIAVEEGTVLIDNSLLKEEQAARGRFTICHEVSHWLLHKDVYHIDRNQMTLFAAMEEEKTTAIRCKKSDIESRGKKPLITDDDWMEWQADYLASALLMPEEPFIRAMEGYVDFMGLDEHFNAKEIDPFKGLWAEGLASHMAYTFDVSLTSAKIRIKNLQKIEDDRQLSII